MSAKVMGAVMTCGPKKVAVRFVLVAIADNADDYGFAYLSMETIADKACCSVRNAIRLVEVLEREGWMEVRRHVFSGRSNVYFVNIEKLGVPVSGKSTKSPMHHEVERMLESKKPSAKLSLGNSAAAMEMATKPGDNSQGGQVTKTALPSDKNAVAILKNHCEPLKNHENPLPPSRGLNKTSGVEPLKGLRTAQEILDHYRKPEPSLGVCNFPNCDCLPEEECPDKPGGVAFQSENGAKHEEIRRIAEASMGSTTVAKWRVGFEGVLKLVHHALYQTSLSLGSKRPPHLADGAVEWQECFESAVVADVESDEITGATRLIVTAKNPRATEAAMKKYRLRIEKGMQQYFGRIVQVSVRSGAT